MEHFITSRNVTRIRKYTCRGIFLLVNINHRRWFREYSLKLARLIHLLRVSHRRVSHSFTEWLINCGNTSHFYSSSLQTVDGRAYGSTSFSVGIILSRRFLPLEKTRFSCYSFDVIFRTARQKLC